MHAITQHRSIARIHTWEQRRLVPFCQLLESCVEWLPCEQRAHRLKWNWLEKERRRTEKSCMRSCARHSSEVSPWSCGGIRKEMRRKVIMIEWSSMKNQSIQTQLQGLAVGKRRLDSIGRNFWGLLQELVVCLLYVTKTYVCSYVLQFSVTLIDDSWGSSSELSHSTKWHSKRYRIRERVAAGYKTALI